MVNLFFIYGLRIVSVIDLLGQYSLDVFAIFLISTELNEKSRVKKQNYLIFLFIDKGIYNDD